MPEPSATYKFARNPEAAIKQAVLRTIEERSDNPRKVWAALLTATGADRDASISIPQFTRALKHFGTGIQLTDDDTTILFQGASSISFSEFQALVNSNH
ncbi:hypothetical protein TL16_g02218 [Triparma laevis f. inornata]|uniref:Uncharacterized protein n=1 Tax=Triparma laevis f. inornata TaxID=1714386 RepID=A0A9W6ZR06_9STRA|nr:hypothetical protein TL16_g02218 [Triparma laevis f. inornata]